MCLVTLNLHIYQDSSKQKKGSKKEQILGNTVTITWGWQKQAYRRTSLAAQLTSNCGRPSAVNL